MENIKNQIKIIMKTKLMTALVLCLTLFNSCEKEELKSNNVVNQTTTKSKTTNAKSNLPESESEVELESMAMAASIEEITYLNDLYEVKFYNDEIDHTISINSFDREVLIQMTISNTNASYNVEIDVLNETIDIENIGLYTFNEYEDYTISSSVNTIKNLTSIMTVYYELNPYSTSYFDDNGEDDTFVVSANKKSKRRFWGEGAEYKTSCNGGLLYRCKNYTVFWITIDKDCEADLCSSF